jgi:hypothetical protein
MAGENIPVGIEFTATATQAQAVINQTTTDMVRANNTASDSAKKAAQEFKQGVDQMSSAVGAFSPQLGQLIQMFGAGAAGASLVIGAQMAAGAMREVVTTVTNAVKQFENAGNEIQKLSYIMGVSADKSQSFAYATEVIGMESQAAAQMVRFFQQNMGEAAITAGGPAFEAFQKLGVSLRDDLTGELRESIPVLLDVVGKLRDWPQASERARLAQEIFGRSYFNVMELIKAGPDEIEKLMKAFRNAGRVMDPEMIEKSEALRQSHIKLSSAVKNLSLNLSGDLSGGLIDARNKMAALVDYMNKHRDEFINIGLMISAAAQMDVVGFVKFARAYGKTRAELAADAAKAGQGGTPEDFAPYGSLISGVDANRNAPPNMPEMVTYGSKPGSGGAAEKAAKEAGAANITGGEGALFQDSFMATTRMARYTFTSVLGDAIQMYVGLQNLGSKDVKTTQQFAAERVAAWSYEHQAETRLINATMSAGINAVIDYQATKTQAEANGEKMRYNIVQAAGAAMLKTILTQLGEQFAAKSAAAAVAFTASGFTLIPEALAALGYAAGAAACGVAAGAIPNPNSTVKPETMGIPEAVGPGGSIRESPYRTGYGSGGAPTITNSTINVYFQPSLVINAQGGLEEARSVAREVIEDMAYAAGVGMNSGRR